MLTDQAYASLRAEDSSWDYRGAFTKRLTHGLHSYPAMMIPQVAQRLIETYSKPGDTVLDPFCGSGSVLVEAKVLGRDSWGVDLNPVALLIARAKTTPIDPSKLTKACFCLVDRIHALRDAAIACPSFFNLDYWFKPLVAAQLARIKAAVDEIDEPETKDFFLVALSETVRLSSNSRSREFKLFRYPAQKLESHNPNAVAIFRERAEKNIERARDFFSTCQSVSGARACRLVLANSTLPIPEIPEGSVDLIVTSPPYGDSRTTVAYGQFSRLSAQWLGLDDERARRLDAELMGGRTAATLEHALNSPSLDKAGRAIAESDPVRARQVLAFYVDLERALGNFARTVRRGGYLCIVIGNRRVKKIQLPTDLIIAEMSAAIGLSPQKIVVRNIPSKTMPLKNSPTNVPGELELTMHQEYIVILRRD